MCISSKPACWPKSNRWTSPGRAKLVEGVVRPNTTRNNWGLLSFFETNVLDQPVLVLGVAGQFVPLRGVEEATLKVGRLAF